MWEYDAVWFWDRVEFMPNGCWVWTGEKRRGYGRFRYGERRTKRTGAHRILWENERGPVPEGMLLDHLCRNRACINPAHLEAVTNRENVLRGESLPAINARKTHCKNGHEFTPENTRIKRGARVCRVCFRAFKKIARQRKAA